MQGPSFISGGAAVIACLRERGGGGSLVIKTALEIQRSCNNGKEGRTTVCETVWLRTNKGDSPPFFQNFISCLRNNDCCCGRRNKVICYSDIPCLLYASQVFVNEIKVNVLMESFHWTVKKIIRALSFLHCICRGYGWRHRPLWFCKKYDLWGGQFFFFFKQCESSRNNIIKEIVHKDFQQLHYNAVSTRSCESASSSFWRWNFHTLRPSLHFNVLLISLPSLIRSSSLLLTMGTQIFIIDCLD